jgi:hypothetical protein
MVNEHVNTGSSEGQRMAILDSISAALACIEAQKMRPNEAWTCTWVISPLLLALGYGPNEIHPQVNDGSGKRPDYEISSGTDNDANDWYLEAKAWNVSLTDDHARQAYGYVNQAGKQWVVLSNGRFWRLYDDHAKGEPADKLVVEISIEDAEAAEEFLQALSRKSVRSQGLQQYARRIRLRQILGAQLADRDSVAIAAICRVLRRDARLPAIRREDVVAYFSEQTQLTSSPMPPAVPEPPPVAERAPDPSATWVPLLTMAEQPSLHVTGRKPTEVRLPDGSVVATRDWRDVAKTVVQWLGTHRQLPELPFRGGRRGNRSFLNTVPRHAGGDEMSAFVELLVSDTKIYLHTHRSGRDLIQRIREVCELAGESSARVHVKTRVVLPVDGAEGSDHAAA